MWFLCRSHFCVKCRRGKFECFCCNKLCVFWDDFWGRGTHCFLLDFYFVGADLSFWLFGTLSDSIFFNFFSFFARPSAYLLFYFSIASKNGRVGDSRLEHWRIPPLLLSLFSRKEACTSWDFVPNGLCGASILAYLAFFLWICPWLPDHLVQNRWKRLNSLTLLAYLFWVWPWLIS